MSMKITVLILITVITNSIADAQKNKIEHYSSCAQDNFQLLVNRMLRIGAAVTPYGTIFTRKYSKRLVSKDIKMIIKTNSIAYMEWSDIYNGALNNLGFKYVGNTKRNDTCFSEKAMSSRYIYKGGYFQATVHLHNDTSIHCRFEIIYPRIGQRLCDCDGCSYVYAIRTFVPFLKYRFEFEGLDWSYLSFTFKCLPAGKEDCY